MDAVAVATIEMHSCNFCKRVRSTAFDRLKFNYQHIQVPTSQGHSIGVGSSQGQSLVPRGRTRFIANPGSRPLPRLSSGFSFQRWRPFARWFTRTSWPHLLRCKPCAWGWGHVLLRALEWSRGLHEGEASGIANTMASTMVSCRGTEIAPSENARESCVSRFPEVRFHQEVDPVHIVTSRDASACLDGAWVPDPGTA